MGRWGGTSLRVLVVDDNPDDRALVHRALHQELEPVDVLEVGTAAGFRDALRQDPINVVITDYALRWGDGMDILHESKARWPDCAVIMFTDSGTEQVAVRAMKSGLDDYLVKSARHIDRLAVSVRRALDRRMHRQRARAAEAQLRELFDRLPAGVYRVNRENRVLYANQTLAGILGFDSVADLIGTNVSGMFVDPDEVAPRRSPQTEDVFTTTIRLRRRDGRVIWIRDSGQLIRDVDEMPLYYEGVIQDVTEVHEAQVEIQRQSRFVELLQAVTATANEYASLEEALAPSLRQIRAAMGWPIAHVYRLEDDVLKPTGIWADDGSGQFQAFRGRTAGMPFRKGEGLPGRALARGASAWMENLPEDPAFIRIEEDDGSAIRTGVAVPVVLEDEVLAVLELFHSEDRERDHELLRVLDKAGLQLSRVAERERAERDRERMEAAAREAQRLDAVGRLAGGIAHDFNNLLTVIRSETDLLLMDLPEAAPEEDALQAIRMAADRAAGLTSQLLAFSREQPLDPSTLELNGVVESMAQLLDRIIGEDITVLKELGTGLPPVMVDRNQLEQVIINLAVNARHAMPEGGTLTIVTTRATVEVGEWPDLEAGEYVQLQVADTGHGMDAATQARIFEPFFTTKAKDRGTGLGLAMAHGVLQQSGGAIHVESAPGEGATFYLWFPPATSADARREEDAQSAGSLTGAPRREPAEANAAANRVGGGPILVVEDDSHVRGMIRKALDRSGFALEVAPDAEAALERLQRGEGFDLVLTDHLLPGMTGLELVRRIRTLDPGLPAILMSGYTEGALSEKGSELPEGVAFLQKPFTIRGLIAAVQRGLARN